jgi:hypothetical protein
MATARDGDPDLTGLPDADAPSARGRIAGCAPSATEAPREMLRPGDPEDCLDPAAASAKAASRLAAVVMTLLPAADSLNVIASDTEPLPAAPPATELPRATSADADAVTNLLPAAESLSARGAVTGLAPSAACAPRLTFRLDEPITDLPAESSPDPVSLVTIATAAESAPAPVSGALAAIPADSAPDPASLDTMAVVDSQGMAGSALVEDCSQGSVIARPPRQTARR